MRVASAGGYIPNDHRLPGRDGLEGGADFFNQGVRSEVRSIDAGQSGSGMGGEGTGGGVADSGQLIAAEVDQQVTDPLQQGDFVGRSHQDVITAGQHPQGAVQPLEFQSPFLAPVMS
jgi:hypothetical protein